MPKISNNDVVIYHKDIKKEFKITVMYNQREHFYAEVPKEFKDIVNHLNDDEQEKLGISIMHKSMNQQIRGVEGVQVISDQTEGGVLSKVKTVITTLMDKAIVQRNVIILFFNPEYEVRYGNHKHNESHPQIGCQIGLTYAVESCVGDKKVYSLYKSHEAFGETKVQRTELSLWNKSVTIIDDTPANRAALESLYEAMNNLILKLKEFASSEEKLLGLIQSNIKLLGN